MPTLLQELRKHSTIDVDQNDSEVTKVYNDAFHDMTSNQLILLAELAKPHHSSILPTASELGKKHQAEFPESSLEALVIDFATALLGIKVLSGPPPLSGSCHAQTCPSTANDTTKTVAHALQLVKVYSILQVPKERICIKIPSTIAGFKACAQLEKHYGVRTLATTCFSAEQGMAAAWAGCQYVAPYVNPLAAVFEPHKRVVYSDPFDAPGLKVTRGVQRLYRRAKTDTQVLAACLLNADEIMCLAGTDHITLSAAALTLLDGTEMNEHFETIVKRALDFLAAPIDNEVSVDNYDPDGEKVQNVLKDEPIAALLADALERFEKAEILLLEMAREECQKH